MSARKFTFDTVFDESGRIVRETDRARVKRSFTPDEVEAIRRDAHAQGTGSIEARAAQATSLAMGQVAQAVMQVLSTLDEVVAQHRAEAAELALAVARKLAGAALERLPQPEIERVIADCLHQMPGEARVVVRVAPAAAAELKARVAEIAHEQGFNGRVLVTPEPSMKHADCRIEWADGGAERSLDALAAEIDALTARYLSAAADGAED